jgi:hypothetical protein
MAKTSLWRLIVRPVPLWADPGPVGVPGLPVAWIIFGVVRHDGKGGQAVLVPWVGLGSYGEGRGGG